jgi:hypothetical protein
MLLKKNSLINMKTNINKVTSKEAWKAALEEKEYGTV